MNNDPTAPERKKDHIDLAFKSQVEEKLFDQRFYYEPMLSAHPTDDLTPFNFFSKEMRAPIWVSSMTGGTEKAFTINENLARGCNEFGLGMGLGSCRSILFSNDRLKDFDWKETIGDQPFYANLGVAQIEELIDDGKMSALQELINKLQADGLIIHVNPLQEWLQPEGDRFKYPPLETIKRVLDYLDSRIIVKEVGQGIGPQSLKELLILPLEAIEFAARGGTNFAKLELLRNQNSRVSAFEKFAIQGHCAYEMVEMINDLKKELGEKIKCNQLIISGGIKHFIDGYYLINKVKLPAIYGQASRFLAHAQGDYEELYNFIESQIEGLKMCYAFLRLK